MDGYLLHAHQATQPVLSSVARSILLGGAFRGVDSLREHLDAVVRTFPLESYLWVTQRTDSKFRKDPHCGQRIHLHIERGESCHPNKVAGTCWQKYIVGHPRESKGIQHLESEWKSQGDRHHLGSVIPKSMSEEGCCRKTQWMLNLVWGIVSRERSTGGVPRARVESSSTPEFDQVPGFAWEHHNVHRVGQGRQVGELTLDEVVGELLQLPDDVDLEPLGEQEWLASPCSAPILTHTIQHWLHWLLEGTIHQQQTTPVQWGHHDKYRGARDDHMQCRTTQ